MLPPKLLMRYGFWMGWVGLALGFAACKGASHAPAATAFDAAAYMPVYPPLPASAPAGLVVTPAPALSPRGPVTQARNAQVQAWLDTVAARNAKVELARGFRIQVYAGADRAAAMHAKETLYRRYPELEPYLAYTQPSFRLVCGDFLSRTEAQLAARRLTKHFSDPLIVPAQVRLKRDL